jgi:hypothetical protein
VDRPPEVVEYVNGPWSGTTEERSILPAMIAAPDGRYVRSVRCADDGAMRYVWRGSEPTGHGQKHTVKEI